MIWNYEEEKTVQHEQGREGSNSLQSSPQAGILTVSWPHVQQRRLTSQSTSLLDETAERGAAQ